MPVAFESSKRKLLTGVLIEQDPMYDAWHVRLHSRPPGLDEAIKHHSVMVDEDRLLEPAAPVTKATINGVRWTCTKCKHENESDGATHAHVVSCCSECRCLHNIVLTDADSDILTAGNPFPE